VALRLLQRCGFAFVLAAFCAACGGTNVLQSSSPPQPGIAPATLPLSATATSKITGTATSCSSFYACVYTIANSLGHGSAMTYYYSPYPYTYNTQASFQLPGESKSTTSLPYKTNTIGNSGSTYHLNGSFTAIDANTEKIVTGTTDDFIIQTKYCFRSCTYKYTLSSGTITFTPTNFDATATSVVCNPSSFLSGGSTVCTATVTDLANAANFPKGGVPFAISGYYGAGTFTPQTCTLSSGKCSVKFTPTDESVGSIGMGASYAGDSSHYLSSGSTTIYVTGN
jgi:hypothetical protein